MHPSGLLILTNHVSALCKGDTVSRILKNVKKFVKSTLYVHLNNTVVSPVSPPRSLWKEVLLNPDVSVQPSQSFHADVIPFVTKLYSEASLHCGHLNVNLLLHNVGTGKISGPHPLKNAVHCILVDLPNAADSIDSSKIIREFVTSNYTFLSREATEESDAGSSVDGLCSAPVFSVLQNENIPYDNAKLLQNQLMTKCDSVVLGGTFDRIHSGHKLLLSEAVLLADRKIVIGISDGPLIERKTLKELIQPVSLRKKLLEEFLLLISRPGLHLHLETIRDPYGPSITVHDLDAILVSKETEKGGHLVNDRRKEKGMSQLKVHVIGQGTLLDDAESDCAEVPFEEIKASSSSARFRLLGTLLKPRWDRPLKFIPKDLPRPYIIGLTGGIAAGKSSVAKRLETLGAIIIDCDKLGHQSYLPASRAYNQIISCFGSDVVADDGTINRKKLGEKVFSDKLQLDALNEIVWPEIERLCKEEILNYMQCTKAAAVFVLDAAVLLEAKWDKFVHEVWVVNVPAQEAVKRIMERNKITEEGALKRIESQSTNEWRTERANVVLSTLWDPRVTQNLVEKAWSSLHQRIQIDEEKHPALKRQKMHKL